MRRVCGWLVLAVYSGKGALLVHDPRGKVFSHCRIYVSKIGEAQVREQSTNAIAIENFGRRNGKRGLKGCLVRKELSPSWRPHPMKPEKFYR
jgi:hypothetical protein